MMCLVGVGFGAIVAAKWLWAQRSKQKRRKRKDSTVDIGQIFGMDIGGTLTKLVFYERIDNNALVIPSIKRSASIDELNSPDHIAALNRFYSHSKEMNEAGALDNSLTFDIPQLGGKLHFVRFETRKVPSLIEKLSSSGMIENIKTIACTGGGAHKYGATIAEELDITVQQTDELACLVRGMHYAIMNVPGECYAYRRVDTPGQEKGTGDVWIKDIKQDILKIPMSTASSPVSPGPYLVVNIGSGVSILKVSGIDKFERVSGTSLGGGTYWGLCRLLTSCSTFEDALDLAESGDSKQIDMLVRDIYGGGYTNMNLSADMVASSFGKLVMKEHPREGLREADLAIALLMMITNNLGQISYLNAKLHGCNKIFFVGSFLRHNPLSCRRLAFAIDFWSGSTKEALFLEHDGYFGALGTFLESALGPNVDQLIDIKASDPHHHQGVADVLRGLDLDNNLPDSAKRPRSKSSGFTSGKSKTAAMTINTGIIDSNAGSSGIVPSAKQELTPVRSSSYNELSK
jgi:type II pantothenate kinase